MKKDGMNNWTTTLVVALLAGLFGFGLMAYMVKRQPGEPSPPQQQRAGAQQNISQANTSTQANTSAQANTAPRTAQATEPPADADDSVLGNIFGGDASPNDAADAADAAAGSTSKPPERWTTVVLRVILRLLLAALLVTILTRRPRSSTTQHQLTPAYVAQTQILLAVVASALMMIVGDSAARAFGIFAAASLVRFRTNIRDPKEITILLVSLAIGLGTGVGRWDLAIVLTLFILPLLWFIERNETEQVQRSMELTVATEHTDETQLVLRDVFKRHNFTAEIRAMSRAGEGTPGGTLVYHVNLNLSISTDRLSEEILTADQDRITSIEWEQQKSNYLY